MGETQVLHRAFSDMLGPGVGLAVRVIGGGCEAVYPAEREVIEHATIPRKVEFATGRTAAREAMLAIGRGPEAIPMGDDRAPVWPRGLTGSITHGAGLAAAAVAPSPPARGIGLDIETATDLERNLWDDVLTPDEQNRIAGLRDAEIWAKIVFCAKEAIYKAQYPQSRTVMEFTDLDVELSRDGATFTATFARNVNPFSKENQMVGRLHTSADLILATVRL